MVSGFLNPKPEVFLDAGLTASIAASHDGQGMWFSVNGLGFTGTCAVHPRCLDSVATCMRMQTLGLAIGVGLGLNLDSQQAGNPEAA